MTNRLGGKVALVTGGAGGMGYAHARAIVAEGGSVVIADVDDARGPKIAAKLGPRGERALVAGQEDDEVPLNVPVRLIPMIRSQS